MNDNEYTGFIFHDYFKKEEYQNEYKFMINVIDYICDLIIKMHKDNSLKFKNIESPAFYELMVSNIIQHLLTQTINPSILYSTRIQYVNTFIDNVSENVLDLYQGLEAHKANKNVEN